MYTLPDYLAKYAKICILFPSQFYKFIREAVKIYQYVSDCHFNYNSALNFCLGTGGKPIYLLCIITLQAAIAALSVE